MIEFELPVGTLEKLKHLHSTGTATAMSNLSIIEEQEQIKQICSEFVSIENYHYGNMFSHLDPFTTHADISDRKQTIMLMPVDCEPDQHFVVFDQTVNSETPVSWIYNIFDDKTEDELREMYYLTAEKIRPADDSRVQGLTGEPVDVELFEHLPYQREFYHGLSGRAWPYTPGRALLFPAQHLHATGAMSGAKTGCTVQFSVPYNQVVQGLNSSIQHNQF